jgi:L-ascorbate metabolism protein UlaG (beta-lactamase superfamily)
MHIYAKSGYGLHRGGRGQAAAQAGPTDDDVALTTFCHGVNISTETGLDKSVAALKAWSREHISWFGQSSFRVRAAAGQAAFIDPYHVPAQAGPAALILVTHPHPDHYDPASIQGLRKQETTVVLPRGGAESWQVAISAGESLRFGAFEVTAVPAYNLARRFHPRSRGWLGYLVEVDGVRIYHAGDTDLVPEMATVRADIALLPVGGLFAMNGRAAAEAAEVLKAPLCIPMHFGMLLGGRGAGARFVRRLGEGGMTLPRD